MKFLLPENYNKQTRISNDYLTRAIFNQLKMSGNQITLQVENVTKRYGDFTAVDSISFNVRAGRIFSFLGTNGAGKTTTIRMIVGITAPDEGRIELFGERVSPQLQDRIGYLPE
ncbi:MAG: ATP-binding cassette domain-containing protein [Pyrinomonadaceae bacterium]